MVTDHIQFKPEDLEEFYGTTEYYVLPPFRNLVYTDGIQYLAKHYEMYWLITDIAIFLPKVLKLYPDSFYCIILKQTAAGQAELIFTNGNSEKSIFSYKYDYANFEFIGCHRNSTPIQEMRLFLQQTQDKREKVCYCLMLPSEY